MTFAPGDLVTAAQLNTFERAADAIFMINGQTGGTVTIRPAGSVTTFCVVYGAAWNETGAASIGSISQVARAPGGANLTFTDGVNTISVVFNANGSITASRTAGTVTWGLRLLVLAL